MMQDILRQFAGGGGDIPSEQLGGHVDTMLQQAPPEHVQGAFGEALQALGPQGFGQSIAQAAPHMNSQQQQGLVGMLGQAIEGGGGSLPGVLGSLGLGGGGGAPAGGYAPNQLGALGEYAAQNHGGALAGVLGAGAVGGGSGVMSMLGNPMVQQVGMNLARRLLGGGGL